MPTVSVLIVDDNARFLDSIERFLLAAGSFLVAGRAMSGREGVDQASALHPDLVLMDLAMPEMNGLEATRILKSQIAQPPKVVIMTMYDTPEYREAARAVGADGFVAKSQFAMELLPLVGRLFDVDTEDA